MANGDLPLTFIQFQLNKPQLLQLMTIFTFSVSFMFSHNYVIITKQQNKHNTKIILGGLSEPIDGGGESDSALFNRKECYKNLDPSQGYEWVLHGNLLRPRAAHQTAVLDGQLHHIAGYAKGKSEETDFTENTKTNCIFRLLRITSSSQWPSR